MAEQKKVSGSGSGDPKKDAERAKWEREKKAMTDRHQRDKEAFARKKELASKSKKESTFKFDPVKEASTKANKLFVMHSAKQIGKEKMMKSENDRLQIWNRKQKRWALIEIGLKEHLKNKEHMVNLLKERKEKLR